MSDEQSKKPLSEGVFDTWFLLPWLAFVVALMVFIGLPFANMLTVCWVKGTNAYFHQGIRIQLGHGLHFSDGSKLPQLPQFLAYALAMFIFVGGPTVALPRILRYFERRKKKAGDGA
ncbi:MAG TPA: hypothetical protein VMF08_03760 [Candidatus Sulfotelmatobacter sp.]|nr:hypothetical protein [Candidatus Sulfotelmatobacter sp.]